MNATLVFDLDGTLAETAPDIMGTLNILLGREGLAPLPLEKARELVGAGARALIERGFKASGVPLEQEKLDRMFANFLPIYLTRIADESFLFPGVRDALDRLSAQGYRLAVCTNKPEPHALALLDALGVKSCFQAVVGRETLPFFKPDPRVLAETIRMAGGDIARSIMIGDSRTDIDTALALGIPSIGVTFGYTDVPMSELGASCVIAHFDSLDGAIESLLT
ncbi:Gph Predicted phosphatases [Rhabdaerophilaceae bacterium]